MLSNLKKREKILLFVALLLALIALYYFYVYQPLNARIDELERDLVNRENRLAVVLRQAGELPHVRRDYELTLQRKQEYLDNQMSVTDLLILYNDLASENDLDLADFNPQQEEEEIHIFSDIVGDYQGITGFFIGLNQAAKLELVDIRLESYNDEGDVIAVFHSICYN